MKKLFACILSLSLILALLAGCAGSPPPDDAAAEPTVEPTVEQTSAPEASEAPAEPSTEEAPEQTPPPATVSYPISDGSIDISYFTDSPPVMMGVSTWSDLPGMKILCENTGINYVLVEVAMTAKTEQFNLMIASGDYTDIIDTTSYTNGAPQAYIDGVIIDIADMVEEHAPDYLAAAANTNEFTIRGLTSASGVRYGVYKLLTQSAQDGGAFYRKDWVDKLGIADPTNIDEFTDLLYAVYDEFHPDRTFYVNSSGVLNNFVNSAFGCVPFALNGTVLPLYLDDDGKVTTGLTSDGYRDYMQWFSQLYADGIVYRDFYMGNDGMGAMFGNIGAGKAGVWNDAVGSITQAILTADDNNKDMVIGGFSCLTNDEGVFDFASIDLLSSNCFSITTTCEHPELALEFMNYNYTEEGSMLANYGVEGESYVLDEAGEPELTQQVYDDISTGLFAFTSTNIPYLQDPAMRWKLYDDMQLEALWKVRNRDIEATTAHTFSTTNLLHPEESSDISNAIADITSYASEAALKFMTGEVELNDQSWQEFKDQCEHFRLSYCVEVYQKALDEYNAGQR